jgi:hypothetical protein
MTHNSLRCGSHVSSGRDNVFRTGVGYLWNGNDLNSREIQKISRQSRASGGCNFPRTTKPAPQLSKERDRSFVLWTSPGAAQHNCSYYCILTVLVKQRVLTPPLKHGVGSEHTYLTACFRLVMKLAGTSFVSGTQNRIPILTSFSGIHMASQTTTPKMPSIQSARRLQNFLAFSKKGSGNAEVVIPSGTRLC